MYDTGRVLDSSSVNINLAGLSLPWEITDIGTPDLSGSSGVSDGFYTMSGSGSFNGTTDDFSFVYQPLSDDGEIKVRLSSIQGTDPNTVAGVMIRETLADDSKYIFAGVSGTSDFLWQSRKVTGGATTLTRVTGGAIPPDAWVDLIRNGNSFSGYESTDGVRWTLIASLDSFSISLAPNIYFGLVVASGSSNVLRSATFTNVVVVP